MHLAEVASVPSYTNCMKCCTLDCNRIMQAFRRKGILLVIAVKFKQLEEVGFGVGKYTRVYFLSIEP